MENTFLKMRGWSAVLAADQGLDLEKQREFSLVIQRFLGMAEKRGWVVGVESAKDYNTRH